MKDFLAELNRRRVVRVGLVYLVVAWVIIQVADTVAPRLALPPWTVTFVILVASLGFPVALVFAWVFDVTPAGVRRTQPSERRARGGPAAWAGLGMVIAIAALGAYSMLRPRRPAETADAADRSLAVLPFVNLSGQQENEYFSDGITEEILNALAKLNGLRVSSRTSSFSMKKQNLPLSEIATRLKVARVLEGSVRRDGDRVRITAQLIDTRTDQHLWSEEYDRDLKDIFAVQADIAHAIAFELKLRLASTSTGARPTASTKAHDLYLRGLTEWDHRNAASLRRAISDFEQAIAEDSSYALAWSGLALAYAVQPSYDPSVQARDLTEKLMGASRRAIALDSSIAEPHAALGWALYRHQYNWTEAENEFRTALRLNPNFSTAHAWYAQLLVFRNRAGEARQASERSLTLDPLSSLNNLIHGHVLYFARQYDEAIPQLRKAWELDRGVGNPWTYIGRAYIVMGQYDSAAMAWGRYAELGSHMNADSLRALVRGLRSPDRANTARMLLRWSSERAVSNYVLATLAASARDPTTAFQLLDRAQQLRDPFLSFAVVDPALDPIRDDARFSALLHGLNLK